MIGTCPDTISSCLRHLPKALRAPGKWRRNGSGGIIREVSPCHSLVYRSARGALRLSDATRKGCGITGERASERASEKADHRATKTNSSRHVSAADLSSSKTAPHGHSEIVRLPLRRCRGTSVWRQPSTLRPPQVSRCGKGPDQKQGSKGIPRRNDARNVATRCTLTCIASLHARAKHVCLRGAGSLPKLQYARRMGHRGARANRGRSARGEGRPRPLCQSEGTRSDASPPKSISESTPQGITSAGGGRTACPPHARRPAPLPGARIASPKAPPVGPDIGRRRP